VVSDTDGNILGGSTPVERESRVWNGGFGDGNSRLGADGGPRSLLFTLKHPANIPAWRFELGPGRSTTQSGVIPFGVRHQLRPLQTWVRRLGITGGDTEPDQCVCELFESPPIRCRSVLTRHITRRGIPDWPDRAPCGIG
jgi:hypothetical protein